MAAARDYLESRVCSAPFACTHLAAGVLLFEKQRSLAGGQPGRPRLNLDQEDAASGRGGAVRGGALQALIAPGGLRARRGAVGQVVAPSAWTAPNLPVKAASATVQASFPR